MPEPIAATFTARHVPGRAVARLCFRDDGEAPLLPPLGTDAVMPGARANFRRGERFAVLWWERGPGPDEQWRSVAVVQAGRGRGETVPDVTGPVRVLGAVGQAGPPGTDGVVDRLLDLLDGMVRARIRPAGLAPTFWRTTLRDIQLGRRPSVPPSSNRRPPNKRSTGAPCGVAA